VTAVIFSIAMYSRRSTNTSIAAPIAAAGGNTAVGASVAGKSDRRSWAMRGDSEAERPIIDRRLYVD